MSMHLHEDGEHHSPHWVVVIAALFTLFTASLVGTGIVWGAMTIAQRACHL